MFCPAGTANPEKRRLGFQLDGRATPQDSLQSWGVLSNVHILDSPGSSLGGGSIPSPNKKTSDLRKTKLVGRGKVRNLVTSKCLDR